MTTKRTINGTKYNIPELVDAAIAAADGKPLDTEKARRTLQLLGHRNPDEQIVTKYARECAILADLARVTAANFNGQIGKIDFSSRDVAIAGAESYLNRRIGGQHARWTESHKRY